MIALFVHESSTVVLLDHCHCSGPVYLTIIWIASFPVIYNSMLMEQLACKLTKDIVGTYQNCNPKFAYSPDQNPKRYLTEPSTIVSVNGHDNEENDLVLYCNQVLANDDGTRRLVLTGSSYGDHSRVFTFCPLEVVILLLFDQLKSSFWGVQILDYSFLNFGSNQGVLTLNSCTI